MSDVYVDEPEDDEPDEDADNPAPRTQRDDYSDSYD